MVVFVYFFKYYAFGYMFFESSLVMFSFSVLLFF